jgi:hypothetical protein
MTTVRQLHRLWDERKYRALCGQLLHARVEASPRAERLLEGSCAAAALGLIRLDELDQSHTPLARAMVRCLIASQGIDGAWGDPLLCSLCLRGLMTARGQGIAIERGLAFLAAMQKSEGIWPQEPLRRMPADPFVSAFILLELGASEPFRNAIQLENAISWFRRNFDSLDCETRKLWHHASMRIGALRSGALRQNQPVFSWS